MRTRFLNSKTGTTLIEVMIALIIIAIVILGGGMFFFYGRVLIVREAHRRAATLVANGRLEELKGANYLDIAAKGLDSGEEFYYEKPYYIVWREDNWKCLGELIEDPNNENFSYDYVTVDNLDYQKMLTQAQLKDDNGDEKFDHLWATVMVEWTNSTTKTVRLNTLIAPREALP